MARSKDLGDLRGRRPGPRPAAPVGPVDPGGPPPYGRGASRLLTGATAAIEAALAAFDQRFEDALAGQQRPRAILSRLSAEERLRLRSVQREHARCVLSPDLSEDEARLRPWRVGRVHAMVGIEPDWYAASLALLQHEVSDSLAGLGDPVRRRALGTIVADRLVRDLASALGGHRAFENERAEALTAAIAIAQQATTVTDLARSILEVLAGLEGFVAGYFGRPDAAGRFQFEGAAGAGPRPFPGGHAAASPPITALGSHALGKGPAGRAWRSGEIHRSDAYQHDPTTAPWHDLGREHRWRSSAAVPLADHAGRPRALLSLYAGVPGYFASEACRTFLVQLQHLLGPALARLEDRPGTLARVVPHPTRMRHAASLAASDVVMHYQPVVALRSGTVDGLEALARLRDGDRLALPGEFLPSFGDAELEQLFGLGLEDALGRLEAWQERGLRTTVAVNMPLSGLRGDAYLAIVAAALARHRIEPGRLTLELLEESDADQQDQVLDRLAALKALGVRLTEDDLGSGYSSLVRLRQLPFDAVKIDQELVRHTEATSLQALSFVGPLAQLGHRVGLEVVVEGLEDAALVEAAVHLGADGGQGYGLSEPLEPDAVPDFARTFRLELDRSRPRTHLGGLAAHLAWEARHAALGDAPGHEQVHQLESCALSASIAALGPAGRAATRAHERLHGSVVAGSSRVPYQAAWDELHRCLVTAVPPGTGDPGPA